MMMMMMMMTMLTNAYDKEEGSDKQKQTTRNDNTTTHHEDKHGISRGIQKLMVAVFKPGFLQKHRLRYNSSAKTNMPPEK